MKNTRNVFIKGLVDEVMGKSSATAKDAYEQVMEFSKTDEFKTAYKKWYVLHNTRNVDYNPVKRVDFIVNKLFNKKGAVSRVV